MVICPARGTYINVRMVFLFSRTNEETTFKLAARSSKHLLLLNPRIGFRLAVRVVAKREVLYSNELTHVNLDRGNTVLLSQV